MNYTVNINTVISTADQTAYSLEFVNKFSLEWLVEWSFFPVVSGFLFLSESVDAFWGRAVLVPLQLAPQCYQRMQCLHQSIMHRFNICAAKLYINGGWGLLIAKDRHSLKLTLVEKGISWKAICSWNCRN